MTTYQTNPNDPISKPNYFNTLLHYSPLCSSSENNSQPLSTDELQSQRSQHYPIFLVNNQWYPSFICVFIFTILFLFAYFKVVLDTRIIYLDNPLPGQPSIPQQTKSPNYNIILTLCLSSLFLVNISYLLTQFLNPGIRNLAQVPDEEFRNANKVQFCQKCQHYKTQKFKHCTSCQVCVWNYDHHCGFFGKCIGGRAQYWSFFAFLASKTAAFIILIACFIIQLG